MAKIQIDKGKALGFVVTVLGLAGTLLSGVVQKNEQKALKEEIKKEVIKELSKEN